MVISSEVFLKQVVVHHITNGILQPSETAAFSSQKDLPDFLIKLLFKSFLIDERFNFSTNISNPAYEFAQLVFSKPDLLLDASKKLASQLIESINSDILKDGEFISCFLEDCVLDDEVTDVIGVFKIDAKEAYLDIEGQQMSRKLGVSQNKITKGVLIFNTDASSGYQCLLVDKMSRNEETSWWKDKFLQVEKIKDNYFQTQSLIQNLQEFAQENFEEDQSTEKISMINESIDYMKKNDFFDQGTYAKEVLKEPDLIERFESFNQAKTDEIPEQNLAHFEVSKPAIKKSNRFIRSVIKLDKNFHVYVHGNRENIIKGFDSEKKKHFYTLFYDEEN